MRGGGTYEGGQVGCVLGYFTVHPAPLLGVGVALLTLQVHLISPQHRSAMLGFGGSKDAWLGEYEEAKTAADHVMELIHERSQVKETEGADAARLTGTVRRCVGAPTMAWLRRTPDGALCAPSEAPAKALAEDHLSSTRGLPFATLRSHPPFVCGPQVSTVACD